MLETYPSSEQAQVATRMLDYIVRHGFLDEVTLAQAAQAFAMRCGPVALQQLLFAEGVETTVEELEELAGTDATGTTMRALIDAAAEKGVSLTGVRASSLSELSAPFIAFVNGNHFVYVSEMDSTYVNVHEEAGHVEAMDASPFVANWHGEALVLTSAASTQTAIGEERLASIRGGYSNPDPSSLCPPNTPSPCTECDGGDGTQPECPQQGPGGNGQETGDVQCVMAPCGAPNGPSGPSGPGSPCPSGPPKSPCPNIPQDSIGSHSFHYGVATSQRALAGDEADAAFKTKGGMMLRFSRNWHNTWGYGREHFAIDAPWSDNIGNNWTHSLNMHLYETTGTVPEALVYYEERGGYIIFYLVGSEGSGASLKHIYTTDADVLMTSYRGMRFVRHSGADASLTLEMPGGMTYNFLPASGANDLARLDYMEDAGGNQIAMEYDALERLTKAAAPSGDNRAFYFSYDGAGNRITKLEMKASTAVLRTINYEYDAGGGLTKVNEGADTKIAFVYGNLPGYDGTYYITKITDADGSETDFDWVYGNNPSPPYMHQAWEITKTAPAAS